MTVLQEVLVGMWDTLVRVVSYPFDPKQRLFVGYLATSVLFSLLVYRVVRSRGTDGQRGASGFFRFLFPKSVWSHPSTWVDVRYFLPHQMVRLWIYTAGIALVSHFVLERTLAAFGWFRSGPVFPGLRESAWLVPAYTVVSIVFADFVNFLAHLAQHRVPILWQFHKIHHSARVLNPLSNYREHPFDNVQYAITAGFATGLVAGVFGGLFHVVPGKVQILGTNVLLFAFNVLGYHLRHSHIWLRWPGPLAVLFGCPAHHQIHHSYEPEHVNRNMAFLFPVWDVLFGTYCLPKEQPKMTFGIGDGSESRYRTFLGIYFLPILELFRRKPAEEPPAESGAGEGV